MCYCYKESNITVDLNEVACTDVDFIPLAQYKVLW
jgi:hypothetical protein